MAQHGFAALAREIAAVARAMLAALRVERAVWVTRDARKTNAALTECDVELSSLARICETYSSDGRDAVAHAALIVTMTRRIAALAQRNASVAFRAERGASEQRVCQVGIGRATFRDRAGTLLALVTPVQ